jgi:serine/threonine protein kinase
LTRKRWQQISGIFKSAIALDNDARRQYLAEKCAGDESLRLEVEKLIASHQQASAENFIGGHAAEDGAVLLSDEVEEHKPVFDKGRQFGSYLILDPLGAGGMGEVYLARDARLDRTVALKVLSADVSSDKRRMQRFRQEARVASSLNQPNILTIFEFGEVEGLTFLATEFIDGETLRDYLRGKRLKVPEILDVAIQILAALDAAHEAHIVHRDIKPENVMIRRRDRVVKVLDFGLAKVAERKTLATDHDSDLEAATAMKTAPGTLMGTINYMSPEQAQSRAVDERTDIWSTGVMLYEMLTGVMPFSGPTVSHTLVQIIENEPPPLTKTAAGQVPAELQRIVRKAMAKSVDDRYQTAKDMLIDLRSLRQQLDGRVLATRDTHPGAQKKRALLIALAAMLVVTAGIFAFNSWRSSRTRSVVPATTAPAATAAVPTRTLTYWITVQPFRNGKYQKPYTLSGEVNFEQQDQIRLNIRSPEDGHLYIINEAPREGFAPDFVVLFPSPSTNNGDSFVRAGRELRFPDASWLRFDEQQGVERLWLVFAEDPLPQLEQFNGLVNVETRGHVTSYVQGKEIQAFLSANSTVKPNLDKGDTLTTLKAPGKLLLYPLKLEHH